MARVFICENIPSLNKGEMEILGGIVQSFKEIGTINLSMISQECEIDSKRYGSTVEIINLREPLSIKHSKGYNKSFTSVKFFFQHVLFIILYKFLGLKSLRIMKSAIWKAYIDADILLIGHNGTFGIRATQYLYHIYLPLFAKSLGKKIILYGGSVPKFRRFSKLFNFLIKISLDRLDLITLRENTSYNNLRSAGITNKNVFVTLDLAFLLPPVAEKRANEILSENNIDLHRKPIIGMTVTREIANKAFPNESYKIHNEVMAQIIDELISRYDAQVIFLPHCIGPGDKLDDRLVARDIFTSIKNKSRVKLIEGEYGAEELKGVIGQFDFFIGERVHSVINAISMGVPSIVLTWKTDLRKDIFTVIEKEEIIYCVENLDKQELLSKITSSWKNKENLKERLISQKESIRERAGLNSKLLKNILSSSQIRF